MGGKGKGDKLNHLDIINKVVNQITRTHIHTHKLHIPGRPFLYLAEEYNNQKTKYNSLKK